MADRRTQAAELFHRALAAFAGYVASPDPVQRACNVIAMIIVCNQPFYPLYVRYLAAPDNGVSCLTFLSTPFFAAVPAIARRWPAAGLAALPAIGMANGAIATLALGRPAGVELFIIPCVLIALLAQNFAFRVPVAFATIFALLSFALVWIFMGEPLHVFTADQYTNLYRLNLFSVAGLTMYAVVTLLIARRAR